MLADQKDFGDATGASVQGKCEMLGKNIHSKLSSFATDDSGNIAIMGALTIMAILIAAGAAVDYSRVANSASSGQSAMDAAVLAGLTIRDDDAAQQTLAKAVFNANQPNQSHFDEPVFAYSDGVLTGTVTANIQTTLLGIAGIGEMTSEITSQATANDSRKSMCFMAMHPTRKHTLEMKQKVSFYAPDCHIYGNSSHYNDVVDPHTVHNFLTGKSVQTVGFGHHVLQNVTPPLEYAPEIIADPFLSMPIPSAFPCDGDKPDKIDGVTVTLTPGNYCDGLVIENSNVTLEPGTYVISGGALELKDSVLQGEGVTLVLADDAAVIDWDNSQIKLSAPKIGLHKSFVIKGVRENADHELTDSTIDIHGIIYIPNGEFNWINKGSPEITAPWTVWIIDGVSWKGFGTIFVNFKPAESDIPYPTALNVIPRDAKPRLIK